MFGITLTPQLIKIIAGIVAIAALGLAYEYQMKQADTRGYTRAQTEYTQRALVASEAARKRELNLQHQLQEAQNESLRNQVALTAAADRARNQLDGLRDELASLSDRLSRASADARLKYARTANAVLAECTARYSELAAKADRHANDALMLSQGWPK